MSKNGFTLIELLVVAVMVMLLSSAAVITYQSAQRKTRDSKRQSDLEQVRAALEMYRLDYNTYPEVSGWSSLMQTLGDYLTTQPEDPRGYSYYYAAGPSGRSYRVCAYMEVSGNGEDCGSGCDPAPADCNYAVTNP